MKEPSLGMTQNGHDSEDSQGLGTLLYFWHLSVSLFRKEKLRQTTSSLGNGVRLSDVEADAAYWWSLETIHILLNTNVDTSSRPSGKFFLVYLSNIINNTVNGENKSKPFKTISELACCYNKHGNHCRGEDAR